MIGCLLGRDARVAVVLRMGRRKVAATKVVVVFLLAVIGERLATQLPAADAATVGDRKSTRLNSSHLVISYAVFCLKKKKNMRKLTLPDKTDSPPHEIELCHVFGE